MRHLQVRCVARLARKVTARSSRERRRALAPGPIRRIRVGPERLGVSRHRRTRYLRTSRGHRERREVARRGPVGGNPSGLLVMQLVAVRSVTWTLGLRTAPAIDAATLHALPHDNPGWSAAREHTPRGCHPAAGWTILETRVLSADPDGRKALRPGLAAPAQARPMAANDRPRRCRQGCAILTGIDEGPSIMRVRPSSVNLESTRRSVIRVTGFWWESSDAFCRDRPTHAVGSR